MVSGRWWRTAITSLGMAKPAPGWLLRHGDLNCGLWDGWWPAPPREWCVVDVLLWSFGDGSGGDGFVWGLLGVAPLIVGDGDEQRDQDDLGDAAVGESALRVTQVEVMALAVEYVPRHEGLRWPSSPGLIARASSAGVEHSRSPLRGWGAPRRLKRVSYSAGVSAYRLDPGRLWKRTQREV